MSIFFSNSHRLRNLATETLYNPSIIEKSLSVRHRLRNLATETRYIIRKWKKRFFPITGDTIPTQYSDNKKHRADSQPCAIVIISCFNNGFNISEYQYTNISIYPNTKYQYIQTWIIQLLFRLFHGFLL